LFIFILSLQSEKHGYEESAKRLALDNENREKNLSDLRKQSRRQYIGKRKEDKMLELKDDIQDDEFLFDDSQLTDRERRERNYKKTVLNLATAHTKAAEIEKVQRYVLTQGNNLV
jgi:pre-mRNA-splicing factor ATP-dependent RNA helicase DHX16